MSEKKKPARKAAAKKSSAAKPKKTRAKAAAKSTAKSPAKKAKATAQKSNGAAPPPAATDTANPNAGLPIFYTKPEILNPGPHAGLKLSATTDYSFASGSNAIPLNAAEFPLAAHHYPIVFVNAEKPISMAVTGLRMTENIFVGDDNKWIENTYIPAYVRRYPFVFMRDDQAGKLTLCIDRDSNTLGTDTGDDLFDGDEMSAVTKRALDFCIAYQQQTQQSELIGALLKEADLLTSNSGTFTLPSGEKLVLTDFLVVDEKKLNALTDAQFVKLRQNGALAAIYMHLASLSNWMNLVQRTKSSS